VPRSLHLAWPTLFGVGVRTDLPDHVRLGQRTEYLRPPKDSRQRQPRRRGFDDDNFFGNTPAPPTFPTFATPNAAPQLQATVKWYNPEKGFGFVELADGSGDVFLHANALQASGFQQVGQGATLQVRVGQGQKGRQVEQVVAVDESTATPGRPGPGAGGPRPSGGPGGGGYGGAGGTSDGGFRSARPPRPPMDTGPGVEMTGTVKWYDPNKGFGFISPQDGSKDVFVHATALERAGHPPLTEGQSVRVVVGQGMKGPEVRSIIAE
jgi:CspA family cold shock protein